MSEEEREMPSGEDISIIDEFISTKDFFDWRYFSLVRRERARELDSIAEKDFDIPTILLMENAGRYVAEHTTEALKKVGGGHALVVAGGGNNGGDGFCAAKHIKNKAVNVSVALLVNEEKIKGDSLQNFKIIKKMGIPIHRVSSAEELGKLMPDRGVIIDAIFGTGLSRDIESPFFREVIEKINRWRDEVRGRGEERWKRDRKVIAVDIPSGLDSNTGNPRPISVKADITVTFAPAKVGLFTGNSVLFAGEVKVEDIGIPLELWKNTGIYLITEEFVSSFFSFFVHEKGKKTRFGYPVGHKGDFGHVLCVCGGLGRAGAAILVGKGALNSGAGLVTIITPEVVYSPVASGAREYMVIPAPSSGKTFDERACDVFDEHLDGKTAVVVGPGIWVERGSKALLSHIIERVRERKIPCVFDADALNILAEIGIEKLKGVRGVITPHPGEAGRLLGTSSKDVQKDRVSSALSLYRRSGCVSVLKGFRTTVAWADRVFINTSGGVELATGGTGDTLSGIIGGLLAQGYGTLTSSIIGVFIHGVAGKLVARERKYPLSLAEKVAEKVPEALSILGK